MQYCQQHVIQWTHFNYVLTIFCAFQASACTMASGRSNSIQDELEDATECSICQEPFNDPRTLPCVHTFCLKCLERWTASFRAAGNGINCPLCRKQFDIPPDGLRGLPVNFFVEKLKNIRKELTKAKSINEPADTLRCENHARELAKVFCRDCCQPLCITCFSESHKLHACADVDKADADVRMLLKQDIAGVAETSRTHWQLIQEVLRERDHYCDHVTSVERLAVEKAEQLKDLVDRHLKRIMDELKAEKENRKQLIGQIVDEIKRHTSQLDSAKSSAEDMLRLGNLSHVVKQVKSLQKIVESMPTLDTLRRTATCIDGARFAFVPSTVVPTNDAENLVGKIEKQVIKGINVL